MNRKLAPRFQASFSLFKGLTFADAKSRENALWAMLWSIDAHSNCGGDLRPPIVVIEGPTASGKTTLAKRLAGHAIVYSKLNLMAFNRMVRSGTPVAIVEDCMVDPDAAEEVRMFAVSTTWCLAQREGEASTFKLRTMLILTLPAGDTAESLPARVRECCVFIKLKAGA